MWNITSGDGSHRQRNPANAGSIAALLSPGVRHWLPTSGGFADYDFTRINVRAIGFMKMLPVSRPVHVGIASTRGG
jgi:hypothetical protein